MTKESLRSWMRLRASPGLGDHGMWRLLQEFGSPEKIHSAGPEELVIRGRLSPRVAAAVLAGPGSSAEREIDRELAILERSRYSVLTCVDPRYPPLLKEIPDPPAMLYVSGDLTPADARAIAIVGSRDATSRGCEFAEELGACLATAGLTVVSGLARGVDAAAHRGALAVGGRTLAVMGCGIDRTYPCAHRHLRAQIEGVGAVLTELPLGTPPLAPHFPRRNRIISGLCLGVVVAEASLESGSLITARLAADQGREVFAVPGFVKCEMSRGTNGLIKQGAKIVERAEDILEELVPQLVGRGQQPVTQPQPDERVPPGLSKEEAAIYERLSGDPVEIDTLVVSTGLPPAVIAPTLIGLELRGLVRQFPGSRVARL